MLDTGTETVDEVLDLCAKMSHSGETSLSVLNDIMLGIMGSTSRRILTLSDLSELLSDAVRSKHAGLLELVALAFQIKKSAAAGHAQIEFVGIGRNPANVRQKDCLLVRFGDRVFSYKPVGNTTPLKRWADRLELILGAPGGVVTFNSLLTSGGLVRVGAMWNLSTDTPSFSELRQVICKFVSEDAISVENTRLVTVPDEGIGSPTVCLMLLEKDTGEQLIRLEAMALLEAIATGAVALGTEKVMHESLVKYVSRGAFDLTN